ncbi:DUF4097 family beta strand repeat-containing protein [Paenibacillus sp. MDMC362]|uniref:DUF4097 family beta strand repeat-containing protein n=1 Tax=Paenibacillus sp. MDMC362 TaxID=2977365 RepID=UPI000DC4274C|nr:DUF4097 family beta strand repeat-containing protein [Paenibacillus sp. MDMC362]RAR44559.1 hypothetical protein DP091_07225 [Paenibacillus sp. MDMC362]
MKKLIAASLVLAAVCGLVIACQGIGKQTFKHETSFEASLIKEIEIHNESWDIELKHTDSPNITIACVGKRQDNESDPVTISHDGNKIVIAQEDQGGMGGFTFSKKGTVYISIPDHTVDAIALNNDAGDIRMKHVAVQNLVMINESGSQLLEGLSADKVEFMTNDGELQLKDSSLNELTVTSGSGDSYITGVTSPLMNIASTAGEVSVKEIEEGKRLRVETESGDIGVSYAKPPASIKLAANSSTSDISVNLDGFKEQRRTDNAVAGTIGNASHSLELSSHTGTITVK